MGTWSICFDVELECLSTLFPALHGGSRYLGNNWLEGFCDGRKLVSFGYKEWRNAHERIDEGS